MKRRDFLRQSTLASGLFFIPGFLKAFVKILLKRFGYKRLVMI